jgi:hypothetical protein
MSPALLRRAMNVFGCDFINAFGAATEGGLQTSLSPADHRRAAAGAEHLLGAIGKPAFETVIADYPGVTAVAVVGQPDEHWGEIVVAFVTASAGSVIEQEALRRFCRERLAA